MKILLHYQGKMTTGVAVNGQCFAEVNRFCQHDLEAVLSYVRDFVTEKNGSIEGDLAITFATPLQNNEEGIEDSEVDSVNSIIMNICGGDI